MIGGSNVRGSNVRGSSEGAPYTRGWVGLIVLVAPGNPCSQAHLPVLSRVCGHFPAY